MKARFRDSRIAVRGALVCLAVSAALADQVVLKNGDRVTGSIVKKDGKTLTIKTDHFGVVTTAWDQVESITSDKPITVVLQDGNTIQGTLTTAGGEVQVAGPARKVSVPPAQITALRNADEQAAFERLEKPGWGQLWAGTAS